jgi:outer membrane translocation and assembly module TamA
MDEQALKACLVTLERPHMQLKLGVGEATCDQPPFDSSPPTLRLWRWPWTEWPSYNQAVFDQDLARILRWYRARGFYHAAIKEVRYQPPEAAVPGAPGACDPEVDQCTVSIELIIQEGEPVKVSEVQVHGLESLAPGLREAVKNVAAPWLGARFDEARYDASKRSMVDRLRQEGFAAAEVQGKVRIDRRTHRADLTYQVVVGPRFWFGQLSVSGHGDLPRAPILAAARLPTGEWYDPAVLREVQAEVFALGAFSAVEVREKVDPHRRVVDVDVHVTPLAPHQLRVGVGVLSGANRRTETGELVSIPQWDVHLLGSYERRHLFGTLGRLRIDERPRMILNQAFPAFPEPKYGNVVSVRHNQPGLVEARTDAFTSSMWDYGPDPFLGFWRSDLFLRLGARRGFLARRVVATLAVQQDSFIVRGGADNVTSDGSPTPASYGYTYLEEDLRLDLRNHPIRPTWGTYWALNATESPRWQGSDWAAIRLSPEARGYLPLPLDMVLALRFAVASIVILDSSPELDVLSRRLGPSTYRLRGGGAHGNRGFLPGRLGAGIQGGLRRWESSLELRIAVGRDFGMVGFVDLGDVNDQPTYRFDHLNTSVGFGLRYHTVIGALRLDVGYRVPPWQRADGSAGIEQDAGTLPFSSTPGALHLTIGESF